MKPSVKTLEKAFPGKGKELRRALESLAYCESFPAVSDWIRSCYNRPKSGEIRMAALNAILEGHGIEHIGPGHNTNSPGFSYVNMGDTYTTTIVRFNAGHYRVADWGSIVERGHYD